MTFDDFSSFEVTSEYLNSLDRFIYRIFFSLIKLNLGYKPYQKCFSCLIKLNLDYKFYRKWSYQHIIICKFYFNNTHNSNNKNKYHMNFRFKCTKVSCRLKFLCYINKIITQELYNHMKSTSLRGCKMKKKNTF